MTWEGETKEGKNINLVTAASPPQSDPAISQAEGETESPEEAQKIGGDNAVNTSPPSPRPSLLTVRDQTSPTHCLRSRLHINPSSTGYLPYAIFTLDPPHSSRVLHAYVSLH